MINEKIIKNEEGKIYSDIWKEYLRIEAYSSEHYVCLTCLKENEELVKGIVRYDSLVLCHKHNEEIKPTFRKLVQMLEDVNAKVYHL